MADRGYPSARLGQGVGEDPALARSRALNGQAERGIAMIDARPLQMQIIRFSDLPVPE